MKETVEPISVVNTRLSICMFYMLVDMVSCYHLTEVFLTKSEKSYREPGNILICNLLFGKLD